MAKYLIVTIFVMLAGCAQIQQVMTAQDQAEEVVYDTAEKALCEKIDVDDAVARYAVSKERFVQWAEFCGLRELIELVESLDK